MSDWTLETAITTREGALGAEHSDRFIHLAQFFVCRMRCTFFCHKPNLQINMLTPINMMEALKSYDFASEQQKREKKRENSFGDFCCALTPLLVVNVVVFFCVL